MTIRSPVDLSEGHELHIATGAIVVGCRECAKLPPPAFHSAHDELKDPSIARRKIQPLSVLPGEEDPAVTTASPPRDTISLKIGLPKFSSMGVEVSEPMGHGESREEYEVRTGNILRRRLQAAFDEYIEWQRRLSETEMPR